MRGWRLLSAREPFTQGRANDAKDNLKVLVLMTDGDNNYGSDENDYNESGYGTFGYASTYDAYGNHSWGRIFDVGDRMVQMIFDGIFERFPKLEVAIAEVDRGWVPYVKEQIDNNYRRLEPRSQFGLAELPSETIERHFHFGFITDFVGVGLRDQIGMQRMLWSSDYPHISADWPHSWRTIDAAFKGVAAEEKALILAGNAQRLYGFE